MYEGVCPGQWDLRPGPVGLGRRRPVAHGVTGHPVGELQHQPVESVMASQPHLN